MGEAENPGLALCFFTSCDGLAFTYWLLATESGVRPRLWLV